MLLDSIYLTGALKTQKKYSLSSLLSNYIPLPIRRAVFKRDGFFCQFCGKKTNLGLSHLIPKSRGGKTQANNLVVSCEKCRRKKRIMLPLEFIVSEILGKELEKLDILGVMTMVHVRVEFKDQTWKNGKIAKMPGLMDTIIYFYPDSGDNGQAPELLGISAIKRIRPL